MSSAEPGLLSDLPASVYNEFCRIMDGLTDLDWRSFASSVLCDKDSLRLAERRERRTDWVMTWWESRNGRVCELVDHLERLQLLRPRDVILRWICSPKPRPPLPFPPPSSLVHLDPPSKLGVLSTCRLSAEQTEGGRPLPTPAPPPPGLQSEIQPPVQRPLGGHHSSRVMCWSFEEVYAGTSGFSPSCRVGEGGFGVVYRANLNNTDCAVKRLRQDCVLSWPLLKESFHTEVDKLSMFRHPNIIALLGVSEGPDCVCLIYSYMQHRSLEDQLHKEPAALSWSQRVCVVEGASNALQFLHSPPKSQKPLIHGDIKSSNILLDEHLVAQLGDFGLARCLSGRGSPGLSPTKTASVAKTETVRGTLAYLPEEYVRDGQLGTAVDVYSFGVVLLEVLTGRWAVERDRETGERYLKDLVEEVEENPAGSYEEVWRENLDQRLTSGGAAEPAYCMEVVSVACKCLNRNRKKRPKMVQVFEDIQEVCRSLLKKTSPSPVQRPPPPSQSVSRPPHPLHSSVQALSQQLSKLGPLEDTYRHSFCSLSPPDPLHSSSLLPSSTCSSASSSPSSSLSSFLGPCETDESRGFSQYDLRSQCRSNRTSYRSSGDQDQRPEPPTQPSIPTEDEYNSPPQLSLGRGISPAGSLHSSPGASDGGRSCEEVRGAEESDELEFLPAQHH